MRERVRGGGTDLIVPIASVLLCIRRSDPPYNDNYISSNGISMIFFLLAFPHDSPP